MQALWRPLTVLARIGVTPDMAPDMARRVALGNIGALVGSVMGVVFSPAYIGEGAYIRAGIVIGFALPYACIPIVAAIGWTTLSRILLVVLASLHIVCLAATDTQSLIWTPLMLVACSSFVVFTHREWALGMVITVLNALLAACVFTGALDPVSAWLAQPPMPPLVSTIVVFMAMLCSPLFVAALNLQVARHDREQEESRQALRAEVQQREALAEVLRQAQREAVSASVAKSAFLANMSHEIRTPLAAVISLGDLAQSTPPGERHDEYLALAQTSARHLLQILNDVLDLSKIEAGELSLQHEPADLVALVHEVAAMARVRTDEKGLQMRTRVDVPTDRWRLLDPLRLKQVLLNLLNNAAKFTDAGTVLLQVAARGDQVEFTVQDTGIGMSSAQLTRVLEPFKQAEASTTRRFGGTGLGLTICRQLLELWGSELQLQSAVGQGTRIGFTLSLEAARVPQQHPSTLPPMVRGPRPLRILVAEDNPVNQLIVRRILEELGHQVQVVVDGRQAVAAAFDGHDLVLMDLQMPEMDGLGATREIRAAELAHGRHRLPVVALTANAMRGDAEACIEAGMDGHLAKPVDRNELGRLLARVSMQRAG